MTPIPIQIYDTTLRDGMQGEGMSLSAGEKLRVALLGLCLETGEVEYFGAHPQEVTRCVGQ